MPNINLSDERNRDAVVKAESTRTRKVVRYIGPQGQPCYTRKLLKATVDHDYDSLLETYKNDAGLADALVKGDPEIDLNRAGMFLWGLSRVYINPKEELVYRIEQQDVVRNPDGTVRERRPHRRLEANVDSEIPLTWTGKMISKADAVRQFVFRTQLQIVHINGLTYDFLFEMAKKLDDEKALLIMGAGAKGNSPLVFRRGSTPYRGFLEGRVAGEKYILLLHLSNLELKLPESNAETGA